MENVSKLNLDTTKVDQARKSARNIALDTQKFIDQYTTSAVERTVCRLFGIDGVDEFDVPLPNVVVNNIKDNLGIGAALYIGNAILHTNLSPQEIAEKVSRSELNIIELPLNDIFEVKAKVKLIVREKLTQISQNKSKRNDLINKYGLFDLF